MGKSILWISRLRESWDSFTKMKLYNYQDIISKQTIHHLHKKNDWYFYEMLVKAYRDLSQKTFTFCKKTCLLSVIFIRSYS